MGIDQTGTKPGVTATKKEPLKVRIRCKNAQCESVLAYQLNGERNRLYQCCECKRTWEIPVGGPVDF